MRRQFRHQETKAEHHRSLRRICVANLVEVKVPDIGDFKDVPVIEILVKPGDVVKKEQSLVTLESDKATMEVPSSHDGTVKDLKVKIGDKISEGVVVVTLEASAGAPAAPAAAAKPASAPAQAPAPARPPEAMAPRPAPALAPAPVAMENPAPSPGGHVHASPSIRAFARELGVDLGRVKGTALKGRITKEDVQGYVKGELAKPRGAAAAGAGGFSFPEMPAVDFTKFGDIETRALSRIKKISGANLHRNWVGIPHVTQHDEADITEVEAFRVSTNEENAKSGIKATMLAFLIKASVAALRKFPEFNASLEPGGENLILKKYYNIGFAADTPNGLVVPVIKNADKKSILEIAKEMSELSAKAREGKLAPAEMSGGCFSISSLGGIGGTYFTPIINAPEVAILGVSRSATKPVWNGREFAPRLMLPMSLS
ncbi:MAG: dihydrolipoyllysine-residue acetyltransferase, partial [Betaproteobacteria bacterium]|nr:dihydrolipoyllysine-residue acetyltransferase [Betaproteobacteria bacterium]